MIRNLEHVTKTGTAAAALNVDSVNVKEAKGYGILIQATVATAAAKTFDAGTAEVSTFTFDTQANTDSGDYIVIYDTADLAWAAAADLTGTDDEPTGAIWAAIPAGRKVMVDLSAAVTAANVAAAFEAALNGLTDVPFVAADSTADVAVTQSSLGVCSPALVKNADDSGAGSVTVVETTPGVDSEVDVDANSLSIPAHGFNTGLKVAATTAGTLPTGLSATDYYVIKIDADSIKLATSQANALAGTAVNITAVGVGTSTLTPAALAGGSYKLQASFDDDTYVDLGVTANITVTANFFHEKVDPMFSFVRVVFAATAGQIAYNVQTLVRG